MSTSQRGAINTLLIPLVAAVLLLVGTLGFAAWAYSSRQDFKNNTDAKIATATTKTITATQAADAAAFAEQAKSPLKTWAGPTQYGSLSVQYPKSWSGYVVQQGGATPVDAFFYPDIVPNVGDSTNSFALRIQIVNRTYDQELSQYTADVKSGKLSSRPFSLAKVPSVVGTRLDGQLTKTKQGAIIILPLRNITVELWTESTDYLADFNSSILPLVTFSP